MPLVEILRLLREKASTPARLLAVASVYVLYALHEGSPLYDAYLAEHSELLRPVGIIGLTFWAFAELWGYLSGSGNLPATQRSVEELKGDLSTITGRQMRLADTIGEPYWETDKTGRMIFSNYANARLYGTTARELLRSGTAPYIHKADVDDAYKAFHQAINGKMGFSIEFDVVDRGVCIRSVRVYAWPLFDDNDNFVGHYGSADVLQEYDDDGNY